MGGSNETIAYGFRIEFKRNKKKPRERESKELSAGNQKSNAMLDFECYKTHSVQEKEDEHNQAKETPVKGEVKKSS